MGLPRWTRIALAIATFAPLVYVPLFFGTWLFTADATAGRTAAFGSGTSLPFLGVFALFPFVALGALAATSAYILLIAVASAWPLGKRLSWIAVVVLFSSLGQAVFYLRYISTESDQELATAEARGDSFDDW